MLPPGGDLLIENVCGRKIRQNLPMRGGILFASTEVEQTLRSDSPLHFDVENMYQICKRK